MIKKNSDRSYLEAKQVRTVKVMACDVLPVAMFSPEVFSSDAPFTAHSTPLKTSTSMTFASHLQLADICQPSDASMGSVKCAMYPPHLRMQQITAQICLVEISLRIHILIYLHIEDH